jgi:L-alanine-DL-glutamate epimerase-like enolase superfamily enzyme
MRIQSIECYPIRIPGHPYCGGHDTRKNVGEYGSYTTHGVYRSIYTMNAETLLVKITSDDGVVGWGETQAAITPHIVAQLVNELVAPGLIGEDPYDVAVLRDRGYDKMRDRGHDSGQIVDAISACDIALYDLLGKAQGKPVHKLLGGAYRQEIPCYVSGVPAVSVEEQADHIRGWQAKGFNRFKISLGYGVKEDITHMEGMRKELGDVPVFLIDQHWVYNLNDSIKIGRAFEQLDIALMECPMDAEIFAQYSKLCSALDLPIALGEEFRTRFRFKERIDAGGIDIAQPDIGRLGITEGMRVTTLCGAAGIPSAPHIGSGLAPYTASALQVAATTERLFLLEFQPTQIDVSDEYFTPSIRPREGAYHLSDLPGLGVEPIMEKIAPHVFS